MIFNEHQYITTKARVNEFTQAISLIKNSDDSSDSNQKLRKIAHLDALSSQIDELEEEITEYESLRVV
jgi:hypothetical protein